MISRVAESCFWLYRYMERIESLARMLYVNQGLVLSAQMPSLSQWRPMVIVAGEEEGFLTRHDADAMNNGALVLNELTWAQDCPVSIYTSLRWARENARTSRETISQEMWMAINSFWLWLNTPEARTLYREHGYDFFGAVLERCQLFAGIAYGTMLREQPFDFMRLGSTLERAGQTARLLDVRKHMLEDGDEAAQHGPQANLFWISVLRSCSARDVFLKKTRRSFRGSDILKFLLFDETFPRAILFCLQRAQQLLVRLQPPHRPEIGAASVATIDTLLAYMNEHATSPIRDVDVHALLTHIVDTTAGVCMTIQDDYFNLTPSLAHAS